jgi:hypothetical protein
MLLFCSFFVKIFNLTKKKRIGDRTMYFLSRKTTNFNTGLGKEFAALSSLCAAGYLWLLLI